MTEHDNTTKSTIATTHPTAAGAMGLVELTSAFSGRGIAIHIEMIGVVQDTSLRQSLGQTLIRHRTNSRKNWEIAEPYYEVMRRIRAGCANSAKAQPPKAHETPDAREPGEQADEIASETRDER